MTKQINIEKASLTILISINGQMHLTVFKKEQYEALGALIKMGMENVIPTPATQSQLNKLLRGEI